MPSGTNDCAAIRARGSGWKSQGCHLNGCKMLARERARTGKTGGARVEMHGSERGRGESLRPQRPAAVGDRGGRRSGQTCSFLGRSFRG